MTKASQRTDKKLKLKAPSSGVLTVVNITTVSAPDQPDPHLFGATRNSLNFLGKIKKRKKITAMQRSSVRSRTLSRSRSSHSSRLRKLRFASTRAQAIRTGGWASPASTPELKFKDSSITNFISFGATAFETGVLLNGLIPDSTASGRIGRKVCLKSLLVRWSINMGTTSTGGTPVRILVVYDKQANATAPAITDILLADHFLSQNNLSNRDRFVTIFDQITAPIATGDCFSQADTLYKAFDLETMFNAGTAGSIADITSGSIYLFTAGTGALLTANGGFNARVRCRYTDQ